MTECTSITLSDDGIPADRRIDRKQAAALTGQGVSAIRGAERKGDLRRVVEDVRGPDGTVLHQKVWLDREQVLEWGTARTAQERSAPATNAAATATVTAPSIIDDEAVRLGITGEMTAMLFADFKKGLSPMDCVIKRKLLFAQVQYVYAQFREARARFLGVSAEERLANLARDVRMLLETDTEAPWDGNGKRYDRRLPAFFDSDLLDIWYVLERLCVRQFGCTLNMLANERPR